MKRLLLLILLLFTTQSWAQGSPAGGSNVRLRDADGNPIGSVGDSLKVNTTGGGSKILDGTVAGEADVVGSDPTGAEQGVVTRNIPSGTQPVSATSLPLPTGAATEATLLGVKTGTDKIPASPSQEHTTAASPHAARLSDGAVFYDSRDRNWTITETVTVTGPLTDTQLRASPVPTSLTSTTLTSTVQPTGLTTITTGQLAVTATVQQLPANAGKIVCIRVKDGGTQNVYFGPSGVTTATGQELIPSEGVCRPTDNTNRYFVIAGGTGSTIAWEAHN